MKPTVCPNADELMSFALGKLPEQDFETVASHIDGCPACDETVGKFQELTDSFIDQLNRPAGLPEYLDEPQFREVAAKVEAIGREPMSEKASGGRKPVDQTAEPLSTIRDYTLLAKLGEGGMGAVYKALHTQLDKVVALKVLPSDRLKDQQAVNRFKREMKAVGGVSRSGDRATTLGDRTTTRT